VADIPELDSRRKALVQEAKTVMLSANREERRATEAETARLGELRAEVERIERQLQEVFDSNRGLS
jgi:hypothetical protein